IEEVPSVDFVAVSLLNGISYGLLLFMVSAGLTLIFGMMGVLNFAHGSFYMLGAYFGYSLARYANFWLALAVAPLAVALIGAFIERFMLRRAHQHGHAQQLLLTFGLLFVFEELVKLFYGFYPVEYRMPATLTFAAFTVSGIDYPFFRLFIAVVAVAMFVAIFLLLRFTRAGLIVRAAVHRPQMVGALGHNVPLVFLAVFALGAGMAGRHRRRGLLSDQSDHGPGARHDYLRGGCGRRPWLDRGCARRVAPDRHLLELRRRLGLDAGGPRHT